MTILSFKPKRRGGGHGAGERHIVFKLKARLLFRRQVPLPPPRTGDGGQVPGQWFIRGRDSCRGAHSSPSTDAVHPSEGKPPKGGRRELLCAEPPSILHSSKAPLLFLLPKSCLAPIPLALDSFLPSSPWPSSSFALCHPALLPLGTPQVTALQKWGAEQGWHNYFFFFWRGVRGGRESKREVCLLWRSPIYEHIYDGCYTTVSKMSPSPSAVN